MLATEFHISDTGVRNVLRRHGIAPSQGNTPVSPSQLAEMLRLYVEEGLNTEQVAARLGIVKSTVFKALKRAGLDLREPVKRHLLSAEQISEGARLYKNGADYRELATKYGVSTACVSDALHALKGFKPRVGWAKYRTTPFCDRKGRWYRFKSSWELAYARYLDAQGKDWEYEPRSYPLVECVKYTPDFEVYEAGRLVDMVDVKGWLDDRSEARILEFKHTYPDLPFRLVGIDELVALGLIPEFYANHPMVVRQRRFQTSGVMDPAGFA